MYKTIFFGDSFTNCNGLSQLDAWPRTVQSMLNQQFEGRVNLQFEISVASQENTRGALERLQRDILFANPDILTVQYGTNDSTHLLSNKGAPLVSQDAFRFNLLELIDKCRLFDIHRLVFITNHPVALDRHDINGLTPDQNTQLYDEIVREVASTSACHLADVREAMANYNPNELCLNDKIHVNTFGAKVYVETVAPVIAAVLEDLISAENQELPESFK
jgi:lysophospholipase L1-like esterase